MKEKIKQGGIVAAVVIFIFGCVLWNKLDCNVWDYKTDYHVLWVGVQLGDFNRYMANNLHIEKYF